MLGRWRARRGLLDWGGTEGSGEGRGWGVWGEKDGNPGFCGIGVFGAVAAGWSIAVTLSDFGGVLRSFCAFGRPCLGYDGDYNGCAGLRVRRWKFMLLSSWVVHVLRSTCSYPGSQKQRSSLTVLSRSYLAASLRAVLSSLLREPMIQMYGS